MAIELMDSDGENRAVRAFLLLYGTNAKTTVGCMLSHLRRSGFPYWPDWVNTEHPGEHLTKAGAQLWIRHLLALEPSNASLADAQAEIARLRGALEKAESRSANLRNALEDIASGEITRSHCVGPHCTEELGVATADEMSSRAAGALDWDDRTK